jgi:hypothetical protein
MNDSGIVCVQKRRWWAEILFVVCSKRLFKVLAWEFGRSVK